MLLRDESQLLNDAAIFNATNGAARVGVMPSRGACACYRMTVGRFEALPVGRLEVHSRRRCLHRGLRQVFTGARW